jgi:hypothetical protein
MFARFAANRSTNIFKRLPTLLNEIQLLLPEFELEKMRYIHIQPVLYNHCHP